MGIMSAAKLLIVDDEELTVRLLTMSLQSDGYQIVTAFNGKQGLEVFKTEAPDIVLTDIKMPEMDGLEMLKKIKEMAPEKEVIIVTGHGDIDSTITALQYGASDFINKPVRDAALAIALERAKAKISIRKKLEEYTSRLEIKIAEATEEIRRKSDFQRLLIRSSNDAIVAFDSGWKVVVYNPEAARLFGETAKDVLNKMTIDDLYTCKIANVFKKQVQNITGQENFPWKEQMIHTKDGRHIPVRYSSNVLYENNEYVGTVNFFQDLTEIKQLEKDLVQSERMAAIGQTVSGLAYYVKHILIGLESGSYLVRSGFQKDNADQIKTGWASVKKNIQLIRELTENLLAYSKHQEPEIINCTPNKIILDVLEQLRGLAISKNISLLEDLDASIGPVMADPKTIRRSLFNIITNAIDACIEDEDISKRHEVHIKSYIDKTPMLCFEVKDNGCGMEEGVKKTLFTPLFRSKRGRGTGLGLLVTGKIIEEHKGLIEIETSAGVGSLFKVRLPYKRVNPAGMQMDQKSAPV